MTEKYNGWTNYETWSVSLWMGNDESLEMTIAHLADEHPDVYDLAMAIKEFITDNVPELGDYNDSGVPLAMYGQLLQGALSEVNWTEIAEKELESRNE